MPWITVIAEPPPQYTHFPGPVIERVLPLAEARRLCGRMGAYADACAWVKRGTCYIVIPLGGPVADLNAYRRHEIAHCSGWAHSHHRYRVERGKRGRRGKRHYDEFDTSRDGEARY